MADVNKVFEDGYGFDDDAVIFGRPLDTDLEGTLNDHFVQVPLRMLNKHGLVAGATGTGKTKTLQLFAEQLSDAGVPVFLADLKGDLAGMAEPSPGHPKIDERMTGMDLPWTPADYPLELLSLTGDNGAPLRVPISSFGPLLLAKVMDCTSTQESVLQVIFKYADENGLALLDLIDLVTLLKWLTGPEGKEVQKDYGGMSTATLNVLLRKAMELEGQGAELFFGEPEFDINDLFRTDADGRGIVSVMNLTDVQDKPKIFSTFMMWLLAEVYEESPEVGDADKPRLVFFFDEAHLLFEGASKSLLEAIELTVRMIRSKGVGVFFVTQNPKDVPEDVLAQLGNRVQHALRAFTPQDQKALKATAQTFPITEHYDVRETLTALGIGEALITVLGPKGAPTPTAPTRLTAPRSKMDPAEPATLEALIAGSELAAKYADEVDRESAHEILLQKMESRADGAALSADALDFDVESGLLSEITSADYDGPAETYFGFRFTPSGGQGRRVKMGGPFQTEEAGRLLATDEMVVFLGSSSTLELPKKKVLTITAARNFLQFHIQGRKSAPVFWVKDPTGLAASLLTTWYGVEPGVIEERIAPLASASAMPPSDEAVAEDIRQAKEAARAAERARKEQERLLRERERELSRRRTSTRSSSRRRSSTRQSTPEAMMKSAARSVGRELGKSLIRGVFGNYRR